MVLLVDMAVSPMMDFSQYLLFFITLLTLLSPPAAIAVFSTVTDRFPKNINKKVALRVTRNYILVMLISITIGEYILAGLGLSAPALMITGGIAAFVAGMPMMTTGQKLDVTFRGGDYESVPRADWETVVAVPLTFPMVIGGATIAIAISTANQTNSVMDYGVLIAIVLLVAVIIYVMIITANRAAQLLGGSLDILTRMTGIILIAIAIEILHAGITGLLGVDV